MEILDPKNDKNKKLKFKKLLNEKLHRNVRRDFGTIFGYVYTEIFVGKIERDKEKTIFNFPRNKMASGMSFEFVVKEFFFLLKFSLAGAIPKSGVS